MNLKNKLIAASFSTLLIATAYAETKITPSLYSRGGMTRSTDLKSRHILNTGDDKKDFNLGAWGDESNTVSGNLTEITVKFSLDDKFFYTYGVDIDDNKRFVAGNNSGDKKSLDERLNFVTFKDNNFSIWVGQNAYRGDGDLLTRSFPFDEHNMMGGGIRLEKVGPVNVEFAYGEVTSGETVDPKLVNIFINKVEYPLTNGKLKTNLEVHRVTSTQDQNESKAIMVGVQLQKWGIKLLGGNFYHLALINYSNGYIYGGAMKSAFNDINKDADESKLVLKWGGDWKWGGEKALFFNVKYQQHEGNASNMKWSFVDYYLRPVKNITKHTAVGIDLAQRYIIKEAKSISWAEKDTITRIALMASYHLEDKMFDLPSISFFAGKMIRDRATEYFEDKPKSREEYFLRLNYEVSF